MALAACQQGPDENIAIDESNSLNAEVETLPPDEGNDETAAANANVGLNEADDGGSEDPNQLFIPAQYAGDGAWSRRTAPRPAATPRG